jgi:hypothetical protein
MSLEGCAPSELAGMLKAVMATAHTARINAPVINLTLFDIKFFSDSAVVID